MKKLLTIILAITMVLTMYAPAFATEPTADESEIMPISAETELTGSQIKASKPTGVKAVSYTYSKIKVTWDKIDGVDGYVVYRATSKNGKYAKAYTTANPDKLSYINTGRTTGKYYYYKIRGFKKINGKTVYTKYSAASGTYARPNKVKINEVYGTSHGLGDLIVDWKAVSGASRYEVQANWKKDGKWSGWKNYAYDRDENKTKFDTYYTLLAAAKKSNPSGKVMTSVDGKFVTLTVEEYTARSLSKSQARIGAIEDDRTYKFRVRAYRTVNGKKVYGAWSNEYTLKETLNPDEILAELRQYTIDYAKKHNPSFQYDDDRKNSTPEDSGYYVAGAWAGFSMYAKQEDVIKDYKEEIERYVDRMKTSGGEPSGFIYIRKSYPGDMEGIEQNMTDETYYCIWMLY